MVKRTLKFESLINMAMFSKLVAKGYLMNTNNLTLTGTFADEEINLAVKNYQALLIDTTDKIYSYETPAG
jgi:hypothetical protein